MFGASSVGDGGSEESTLMTGRLAEEEELVTRIAGTSWVMSRGVWGSPSCDIAFGGAASGRKKLEMASGRAGSQRGHTRGRGTTTTKTL